MKITEKQTVTKKIEVTKDILCNKCGNTCSMPEHRMSYYGLVETKVSGGYCSNVLDDLTTYTFSLCEGCLKGLFGAFTIPVQIGSYPICG